MEKSVEEPKPATISELKNLRVIKIAQNLVANPKEIPKVGPYAIFFSEEDYPALSPVMWNQVAQKNNFDFQLVLLVASPQDLPRILTAVKAEERLKGGVFGVGFKDEVGKFLDWTEPTAEISNSVNVFVKKPESIVEGYNTDAVGFVKSLEEKLGSQQLELLNLHLELCGQY